jgi:hypothetical protein
VKNGPGLGNWTQTLPCSTLRANNPQSSKVMRFKCLFRVKHNVLARFSYNRANRTGAMGHSEIMSRLTARLSRIIVYVEH